ncbi:hypothetical protein [Arthrobacter castelli]|uniref:hypothetical protein n=1 Tax=Arthrobacter castelli TaxID=271431 RepID=UPI00040CC968|nr:hypothetical protein [Arthrobacter castelli]
MSEQQKQTGLPGADQMARGFGFITAEDRAKWDQARQQQAPKHVSALKEMMTSAASSASEVGQQKLQARLKAAEQVEEQEKREQSRTTRRTINETVDYADRDDRKTLDTGMEF